MCKWSGSQSSRSSSCGQHMITDGEAWWQKIIRNYLPTFKESVSNVRSFWLPLLPIALEQAILIKDLHLSSKQMASRLCHENTIDVNKNTRIFIKHIHDWARVCTGINEIRRTLRSDALLGWMYRPNRLHHWGLGWLLCWKDAWLVSWWSQHNSMIKAGEYESFVVLRKIKLSSCGHWRAEMMLKPQSATTWALTRVWR